MPHVKDRQRDLFRIELTQIIDTSHALVKLAEAVDWDRFEEVFGTTYCPDDGRSGISTRLVVALHYLKYTHNLRDDHKRFELGSDFFSLSFHVNDRLNGATHDRRNGASKKCSKAI